jgi:NADH-quinone oxidoreductase subunit J
MIPFLLLSLFSIATAIGVVALRNPIHSALCLVANLLGVAALFASLDAHFLAVVQIIVYAGAIVVLVLFVLMLLNIKTEVASRREKLLTTFAVLSGVSFLFVAVPIFHSFFDSFHQGSVFDGSQIEVEGTVLEMGKVLYTRYVFTFEIASVLIMAALVGAVMLGKRNYRKG